MSGFLLDLQQRHLLLAVTRGNEWQGHIVVCPLIRLATKADNKGFSLVFKQPRPTHPCDPGLQLYSKAQCEAPGMARPARYRHHLAWGQVAPRR